MPFFGVPETLMAASSQHAKNTPAYYACLGVDPSISAAELTKHYRRLSLKLHPDRAAYRGNPSGEAAVAQRFQEITEAYTVLSDPTRRSTYDTQQGLNFFGRVSSLQRAIQRHNQMASDRRAERDPTTEDVDKESCSSPSSRVRKEVLALEEESDDEDEYIPDDTHATAPLAPRGQRSLESEVTRTLHLRPWAGRRNAPCSSNATSTLRGTTIFKAVEDSSWGLELHGQRLLRCRGHGGIPYPALVTQINGRSVGEGQEVAALIAGGHVETIREEASERQGAVDRDLLHLTLSFHTASFDIGGDLKRLADRNFVDQVVPRTLVAAEIPDLLPGQTLLSVNDESVHSAEELRNTLHVIGRRIAGGGVGTTTLNYLRVSCATWEPGDD